MKVALRRDNSHLFSERTLVGVNIDNLVGIENLLVERESDGSLNLGETKKKLPYSELNASDLLQTYFNADLRYSAKAKMWRIWNGRIYDLVDTDTVPKMIRQFARKFAEALNMAEEQAQKAADANWSRNVASGMSQDQADTQRDKEMKAFRAMYAKHLKYEEKLHSNAGMESLAKMLEKQCAYAEDLYDSDTTIFVVENFVLDLSSIRETRQVQVMPHDPVRDVTMFAPVKYLPDATCPSWDHYLATSIPDPDARRYLQRWCGAAMLGEPVDKGFLNLRGDTDSGKSVFLWAIKEFMGESYSTHQPSSTFVKKPAGQDKNFELHEMRGKRFVTTSETGEGEAIDDNLLKTLTGDDPIKSRTLYQGYVTWTPQCTIFVASNHDLRFNAGDTAMANRYKVIAFPKSFSRDPDAPEEIRADLRLKPKLRAERDGILNWFLHGLVEYVTEGIGEEPASVRAARETLMRNVDTRVDWLEEMLESQRIERVEKTQVEDNAVSPWVHRLSATEAYENYKLWCGYRGLKPFSQKKFGELITQRFPTKRNVGCMRYLELRKTGYWSMTEEQIEAYREGRSV
jgi:P4 family phage/plasmid primase-like protien